MTQSNQMDPTIMQSPAAFTVSGRLRSFAHAFRGIAAMLGTQHNAWLHAGATLTVVVSGALLRISHADWCWIILAIVGVWTAEALNTAFEFLCDVASPGFHPKVKSAKDVAAGAVLISAAGAVAIGLLVLVPYLMG